MCYNSSNVIQVDKSASKLLSHHPKKLTRIAGNVDMA
jgi:hypothetical protein